MFVLVVRLREIILLGSILLTQKYQFSAFQDSYSRGFDRYYGVDPKRFDGHGR